VDDFTSLLDAARRGDARAWTTLYDRVAPVVLSYLRSQRAPEAEDITGEVLLQVVRDLHRFSGDESNLRSWVLTIAHHRLIDARRYSQRRPAVPTDDDAMPPLPADEDVATEVVERDEVERLVALLDVLTPEQRTVVLLREVSDLSVRDDDVARAGGPVRPHGRRGRRTRRPHG
jgi:RNA polymerase sigma factor (sigma-70 family)